MARGNLNFYPVSFSHPWPLFGVKFNQQLDDARTNMRNLAPIVRAATLDQAEGNPDDKELAGFTYGELEFRSRFRTFYDRDGKFFKIQVNRGTEGCPDWRDCLTIRSSDCQVFATGLGGIKSVGGFYGGSGDFPGAAEFQQFYGVLFRDGRLALRDDELNFNPADFYLSKDSRNNLVLNSISAGGGGSGQNNTGSNVGTGAGVFKTKIGADLKFRSLVEGSNITIVEGTDEITISSAAAGGEGGGGFYGIVIEESDQTNTLRDDTIRFKADEFDISEVNDKPQVALSSDIAKKSDLPLFYGVIVKEDGTVIARTDSLQFEADDFDLSLLDGDVRIALANPGGSGTDTPGFYGIIIEESDQTNTLRNDTIRFKAADFNLSEVNNKPQVAISTDIARKSDITPGFYGIVFSDGDTTKKTDKLNFNFNHFYITCDSSGEPIVNLIDEANSGEANTASNVGSGAEVFKQKSSTDLEFRSIIGGIGIDATENINDVTLTIDNTVALKSDIPPGFYGIIIEESDQTNTLRNDTIRFLTGDFDVSEVNDKPQISLDSTVARKSDLSSGFYGIILKEDDTVVGRTDTLKFLGSDFSIINEGVDLADATLEPDTGGATTNKPLENLLDGLADSDLFDSENFGLAVDFTPRGDKIASTGFSTLGIANSWTISTWINHQDVTSSNTDTAVSIFESSGNDNSILIQKISGNVIQVIVRKFDGGSSFQQFNNYLMEGSWNHIVVVKHSSDDSYDVYIDGVLRSADSSSAFQAPTQTDTSRDITFGSTSAAGAFDGYIGQTAFWSTELSASEIASIFEKTGQADLTTNFESYSSSGSLEHYYFAYGGGNLCITLDSTVRSPGFYGIVFSDGDTTKVGDNILFNPASFYLTCEREGVTLNLIKSVPELESNIEAAGPGFYGITIKEDSTVIGKFDSLQFEADDFDISSQDGDARIALANPGAMVLLATATASNNATIDFTSNIDSTYKMYVIHFQDLIPVTDNVGLNIRLSISGTFQTGTIYGYVTQVRRNTGSSPAPASSDAATSFQLLAGGSEFAGTGTGEAVSGFMELYNPAGTSVYKYINVRGSYRSFTPRVAGFITAGHLKSTSAVDGIRFFFSSGNVSSGTFQLYGIRSS